LAHRKHRARLPPKQAEKLSAFKLCKSARALFSSTHFGERQDLTERKEIFTINPTLPQPQRLQKKVLNETHEREKDQRERGLFFVHLALPAIAGFNDLMPRVLRGTGVIAQHLEWDN
jgi:hypothetical protein